MASKTYKINPTTAPRMTKADRWKKRPVVMRYFAFRDEVNRLKIDVNNYDDITFHISMPPSWSKKKKKEMNKKPHTQVPDIDNLLKALLDSVFRDTTHDDSHIYALSGLKKFWAEEGSIQIN